MFKAFLILTLFCFYSAEAFCLKINSNENHANEVRTVMRLARKCKQSNRENQTCNQEDTVELVSYIVQVCSNMPPNTHQMNKLLFEAYIKTPMLNTAFLRGWGWVNSDISWPVCVVCLLNFPLDPHWESHFSFCRKL